MQCFTKEKYMVELVQICNMVSVWRFCLVFIREPWGRKCLYCVSFLQIVQKRYDLWISGVSQTCPLRWSHLCKETRSGARTRPWGTPACVKLCKGNIGPFFLTFLHFLDSVFSIHCLLKVPKESLNRDDVGALTRPKQAPTLSAILFQFWSKLQFSDK